MANYDAFYRRLTDLAVMIGQAERHAESLAFDNTAGKLQDMRASVTKIAGNVMTKIEAEHIARLERRKHLSKQVDKLNKKQAERLEQSVGLYAGRPLPPSSMVPSAGMHASFSPSNLVNVLGSCGLNVHVIDENTDFSKLPIPGQDCRTEGSVESPQADPPIDLSPPTDSQ